MLSWVLYLYYYMFLSFSAPSLVYSVPGTESNSAGGAENFVERAEKKLALFKRDFAPLPKLFSVPSKKNVWPP